jgi:serine/threonine protein kinase
MPDALPNETFGPYRIIEPLGKGGMGEVFVAFDERLDRRIALKFLSESAAGDNALRHRFLAEARAASALQHPNIVTIFDVGHDRGRDYFAMELVEGRSLRAVLRSERIPSDRAVAIAADMASALAAAHARGIIHRDIKPENIIITSAGQAKVLDFGIAKVITDSAGHSSDSPTEVQATRAGTLVGTVTYMSPEQASGIAVDHRSDIYSLGVVLYEMLAGRPTFSTTSAVDHLYKIVHDDPTAITLIAPDTPERLALILEKALTRDREWRYQSAADMKIDLLRPLSPPAKRGRSVRRSQNGTEPAPAEAATGSRRAPRRPAAPAALDLIIQPLTSDGGYADDPTISPDGQMIAYVSDRSGTLDIYLKQISGGPDINLTSSPSDDIQPSFSPDGRQIAFVSSRASSSPIVYPSGWSPLTGGDVWVMSAFGGTARKLADQGNDPSWSADGKSLLFATGSPGDQRICRVAAVGGEPESLPIAFESKHLRVYRPRESPDGKWIAFGTHEQHVYVAPVSGGAAIPVALGWDPVWTPDSRGIVFSRGARNRSLWRVAILGDGRPGDSAPITNGIGRDAAPAISRDGRTLVFAAQRVEFNIERVSFDAESGKVGEAREVLTRGPSPKLFFDVFPDGRALVCAARENEMAHLWRHDPGQAPIQLTTDPTLSENSPRVSPDGTRIAFLRALSDGSPEGDVWTMRSDGTAPEKVIGGHIGPMSWTPDGSGIAWQSREDRQIYIFDLATRTSRRITSDANIQFLSGALFSADGQWVIYQSAGSNQSIHVSAAPMDGGPSRVVMNTARSEYHPFLSPSGKWLYAIVDHKNVVRVPGPAQDWRATEPEQVTFFPESNLMLEDPKFSRDGAWLLFSRKTTTSDIWTITRADGAAF